MESDRELIRTPIIKIVRPGLHRRVYILGGNGKIMFTSERYYDHWNAQRAAFQLHTMTGWPVIEKQVILRNYFKMGSIK